MNDNISKVGAKIKEIRRRANITQAELASLINVDPKYISRLETGSSTPSLTIIFKISDVLKTDIAQFFMFDTRKQREELMGLIVKKLSNANIKELNAILEVANCITK